MGFAAEQGGGFQQRRTGKPGGIVFTPANRAALRDKEVNTFWAASWASSQDPPPPLSWRKISAAILHPECRPRNSGRREMPWASSWCLKLPPVGPFRLKNCVSDLFKYGRFPDDGRFGPLGRPVRRSLEKEKISVAWGTGVA
jgi:hypothetical protein